LVLAARLQAAGADVVAFDPIAEEAAAPMLKGVEMKQNAAEVFDGIDAAVLVTEWAEFKQIDWSAAAQAMRGKVVIDGRNHLDGDALRGLGFTYEGIGRGGKSA
jgi:UDPglucose 6-dehydrogenase